MSTRYARTADKALNEKHSKILKDLLKKPANKYCADCKRKDPRWASWNIGVFVCIRCSGVHRSMGTHISKVKSVDLDTWIPDQVENMIRWGNERANKYWEANLKDKRPSESNIDMWIRAKYDQKRWAMRGPIPDPSTLGGDDDVVESGSNSNSKPSSPVPSRPKQQQQQPASPKPKSSDLSNLDDFFGSPTTSSSTRNQSPVSQLQGADFFFNSTPSNKAPTTTPPPPPQQQQQPPSTPPKQQQQQPAKSAHDDLKSSILSLYSKPSPAPSPTMAMNNGGYANNMSSFQQQLSGLSLGTSGMIPQAPAGHSLNNGWGAFADANTSPMQSAAQPSLQGSQFFASNGNNSNNSNNNTPPAQAKQAYDAFADLLK
ncbi:hypothetical protein LRAMOSA10670 [Lichtheimia ramosa]|uniref:Arf-GAP domain-containing protein n=1 Tax=Lichtheimia ramosa TaxID=688394 RepID=A0A077WPH0_9FUNG|nr:hypothetical protein LRAMOSA10670 [Lichtheimia ramosa]